jgi:hypothetical protein
MPIFNPLLPVEAELLLPPDTTGDGVLELLPQAASSIAEAAMLATAATR